MDWLLITAVSVLYLQQYLQLNQITMEPFGGLCAFPLQNTRQIVAAALARWRC
jgi:hypothetical protein